MIRPAAGILSFVLATTGLPAAAQDTEAPASDSVSDEQWDAFLRSVVAEALEETLDAENVNVRGSQLLTSAEKTALKEELVACWNVVPLSTEALASKFSVAFSMKIDGTPVSDSIRLLYSEGSEQAVQEAFEAARKVIVSCSAQGYDLPPEKYEHWAQIEITFGPRIQ